MTYPARDPPTQGIAAGVNAGPFPALPVAEADGDGLLTIAMCGANGRRGPYGSYVGGAGFLLRVGGRSAYSEGS